jgi:hypothetical protein
MFVHSLDRRRFRIHAPPTGTINKLTKLATRTINDNVAADVSNRPGR